jgi:putative peptidoglycan lipid II flippase
MLLILLQLPGFRGAGLRIVPSLAWRDPILRRIGTLYLPVFLGLLLNSWALIVDRNLASRTGEHGIAAMRFATQVQQLAVGIVVTAINVATLPRLSRAAAEDDQETFGRTLALGMRLVTTLVVPVTFGLIALSWPVVDLLFNHGKTTLEGARLIRVALIGYAVGLPFIAWDQLLLFAFYARKNTRTPVIVGAISVGVLLGCSFALILPFGVLGLVIANTMQFAFHAAVMFVIAKRRIVSFDSHDLLRTIFRTGLAAIAMTAVVLVTLAVVRTALPGSGFTAETVRVVIPIGVGAAVYAVGVWLLRLPEARYLAEVARSRLPGR